MRTEPVRRLRAARSVAGKKVPFDVTMSRKETVRQLVGVEVKRQMTYARKDLKKFDKEEFSEREFTYWKWLEECNARKIENALQTKLLSDVNAFDVLVDKLSQINETLSAITRGIVYAQDVKKKDLEVINGRIKNRKEVTLNFGRDQQ